MKVILLIWISAVFVREVVPGVILKHPRDLQPEARESEASERHARDLSNPLHSSVHTEYEANYQQKSQQGNQSFSTVKGKQEIVHDNCSDNWNEFAEKCAALIKDLVASLANAISSNPGDTTNLQLQIKNSFRHFDSTNNCSCFNGSDANIKKIGLDLPLIFNRTSIPGTSNHEGQAASGSPQSADGNGVGFHKLPESDVNLHDGASGQLSNNNRRETDCSGSSCGGGKTGSGSHSHGSPEGSSGSSSSDGNSAFPVFIYDKNRGEGVGDRDDGSTEGDEPSGWAAESSHTSHPQTASTPSKTSSGKPNLPPYFLPLDVSKQISQGNPSAGSFHTPTAGQNEASGHSSEGDSHGTAGQPLQWTPAETKESLSPKVSGVKAAEVVHGSSMPSSEDVLLKPVEIKPKITQGSYETSQGEESDCNEPEGSSTSGAADAASGAHAQEPVAIGPVPTQSKSEGSASQGLTQLGQPSGIGESQTSGMSPEQSMDEQVELPLSHYAEGGSRMTPSDSLIVETPSDSSKDGCDDTANTDTSKQSTPEVILTPFAGKTGSIGAGKTAIAGAEEHLGSEPHHGAMAPTYLDAHRNEEVPAVGKIEEPEGVPAVGVAEIPTTGIAKGPATGTAEGPAIGIAEGPATGTAEEPAIGIGEGPATGTAEGPAVGIGEGPATGTAEGPAIRIGEGPATGTAEGPAVGIGEGPATGRATGTAVGIAEGPATGTAEGPAIGIGEGSATGPAVGIAEGPATGTAEGPATAIAEGPESELPSYQGVESNYKPSDPTISHAREQSLESPQEYVAGHPASDHQEPSVVLMKPPTTDLTSDAGKSNVDSALTAPEGQPESQSEGPCDDDASQDGTLNSNGPSQVHEYEPELIRPVTEPARVPQGGLSSDSHTGFNPDEPTSHDNSSPAKIPLATIEPTQTISHNEGPSQTWATEPKHVTAPTEPTADAQNYADDELGGRGLTTPQRPTTFQTTSVEPTQPQGVVLPAATTPSASPHSTPLLLPEPDKSGESASSLPAETHHSSSNHHLDDEDEDDEDDECCSCEACDDEITNHKEFRKATCKDLQEAKRELKAIFDKIQKRLKCGRRAPKAITTSPVL